MKKRNNLVFMIFVALFWVSCEKEEQPISAPPTGNLERADLNIKPDYSEQHYFGFELGEILSSNKKIVWDLRLSCTDWNITLNTAKAMKVAIVKDAAIETATLPDEPLWLYDHHEGKQDSIAIGNHWSSHDVYFIDKGYDAEGNMLGLAKVTFEKSGNDYLVRYAMIEPNNSEVKSILISPRPEFQNIHLAIDSIASVLTLEPAAQEWDIYAGQYTYLFYAPTFTPYLVSGILINPESVEVYVDTTMNFSEISLEMVESFNFTSQPDIIGYDWKYYDFDKGNYEVDTETNYILRTKEGYFYKMHFLDFYSPSGEKGNMVFEYQRL